MRRVANDGPLPGVLDEMDRIVDDHRARSDRGGYFAAMYRGVTREIDRRCRLDGFEDSERMVAFASAFAQRYLDAVAARRSGALPSQAWRVAFDQGDRWRPVVLQHLMLGMNAHINLDLGVVTASFADRDGLDAMVRDFARINDVLATMTAACQRAVGEASPWIGVLDRWGGRTDSSVVRFSIVRARTAAWHTAERLSRLDAGSRQTAVDALDRQVADLARLVLETPVWGRAALLAVRARETASVRSIIDRLSVVAPTVG